MGDSIYRFRQVNTNSISSFMKDEMYASTPDQFNDPYDALFNYDPERLYSLVINDSACLELLAKDMLFEIGKENTDANIDDIRQMIKSSKSEILKELNNLVLNVLLILRRQMVIACFCTSNTKEIMWSHYTDYGKGFVLEYDKDDVVNAFDKYMNKYLENNKTDFSNVNSSKVYGLKQVDYNSTRFDGTNIAFAKIKEQLEENEMFRNGSLRPRKYDWEEDEFNSFVLYKAKSWEYEDELRLILPNHDLDKTFSKIGIIKPKAVYLGEFISFNDEYTICCIAKTKGIPIYKMISSFDKKRFGLTKHKLTDYEIKDIVEKFNGGLIGD